MTRYLAIAIAVLLATNIVTAGLLRGAVQEIGTKNEALRTASVQLKAAAGRLRDYQAAAEAAVADTETACRAASAHALRAGRAIEGILHAPRDPTAPRRLVGAGELRDVVGQPAAEAVPAGRGDGGSAGTPDS
jgi:hypothetical protein